jgi:hypothetical protein
MSGCAIRRWGVGTSCSRPTDTPAAREMNATLKEMQAERARQDAMLWGSPTDHPMKPQEKESKQPTEQRNQNASKM